jgi:putative ABC transport system permease protein
MSSVALSGAVETGLVYALVAIGVYLSFRVLDFPDLTGDGAFALGAAVTASLIVRGIHPWFAMLAAVGAGAIAGVVTATLNVRFRILHLLASILTMFGLYSVNIRIMGRANVAIGDRNTVLTPFLGLGLPALAVRPLFLGVVSLVAVLGLAWFLASEFGLAMRATGMNPRMARSQGVSTDVQIHVGIALSNALIALAGALFAQTNKFADVTLGTGTVVVGLAAVIVGETLLRGRGIAWGLVGSVLGSIVYRLMIQVALSVDAIGLQASDLNFVIATLIVAALILPRLRRGVTP